MNASTDSLFLLFSNERDKMLKVFETRLLQFELKIQLLLEKLPKCECLNQENRVLRAAMNLETKILKISQQMELNDISQQKLLKQLAMLNENKMLHQKHSRDFDVPASHSELIMNNSDCLNLTEGIKAIKSEVVELEEARSDSPFVQLMANDSVMNRQPMFSSQDDESCVQQPLHKKNSDCFYFETEENDYDSARDQNLDVNMSEETTLKNFLALRDSGDIESSSGNSYVKPSLNNLFMPRKSTVVSVKHTDEAETLEITKRHSLIATNEHSASSSIKNSNGEPKPDILYRCDVCDGIFSDRNTFKRHRTSHSDRAVPPKHKCQFCSYSSDRFNHMKRHLRVHTKEKPFQCSICLKRFSERGNLNKHIVVHTKHSPYECKECGKKFKHGATLQRHINTVHNDC